MSTPVAPDYETLANTLLESGALASPSELHGMLVGQLAGGKRFSEGVWLAEVRQWLDAEGELAGVAAMPAAALAQLEGEELGLRLLLPEDDDALEMRTQALAEWCQGFLEGFVLGHGRTPPEEVTEWLEDLSAIAQVGLTDEDSAQEDEQNEVNYAEIEEYVRMAAQAVFAECGRSAETKKPRTSPTIH